VNVAIDVQRYGAELDELDAELKQWQAPDPPGLSVWRHKLYALIGEILDPEHALAIRLSGVRLNTAASSSVRRWGGEPVRSARNFLTDEDFNKAKQDAAEIIEALRWELGRYVPATDPFTDATVDPELWEHVRGLIEAKDWEKVARETAVFVEDKLRNWASVPQSVTGSVNVFKAAIGSSGFALPQAGPPSEQQGWQQLATGFALALRNPSGHQVRLRKDAERYALGVLGMGSLLLTEVRHEHGDPPKL
jgi:hypothetical protein